MPNTLLTISMITREALRIMCCSSEYTLPEAIAILRGHLRESGVSSEQTTLILKEAIKEVSYAVE